MFLYRLCSNTHTEPVHDLVLITRCSYTRLVSIHPVYIDVNAAVAQSVERSARKRRV